MENQQMDGSPALGCPERKDSSMPTWTRRLRRDEAALASNLTGIGWATAVFMVADCDESSDLQSCKTEPRPNPNPDLVFSAHACTIGFVDHPTLPPHMQTVVVAHSLVVGGAHQCTVSAARRASSLTASSRHAPVLIRQGHRIRSRSRLSAKGDFDANVDVAATAADDPMASFWLDAIRETEENDDDFLTGEDTAEPKAPRGPKKWWDVEDHPESCYLVGFELKGDRRVLGMRHQAPRPRPCVCTAALDRLAGN